MSVKRKFNFPMSTLVKDGDSIISAAESHPTEMNKRLGAEATAAAREVLGSLGKTTSKKAKTTSDLADATDEQEDQLIVMLDLFGQLKDSARRAFKGQEVKLKNDFKVGENSPADLGSVLERTKVAADSAGREGNAAALAKKGWIADDTAALLAAIEKVEDSEAGQERSRVIQLATTDERNTAGNDLFEKLLTIQNAANIQWPARNEANRAVRREFLLDVFPPSPNAAKAAAQPPAVTPKPAPVPV